MDELPLGRKIYVLREDRSLSQSKLEVEAGLSFGTLSRIENGNINPTKETIIKIAQVLGLHDHEFQYLISPVKSSPDMEEIESIVESLKDDFKSQLVPCYLIDNQFRIWLWNDSILGLFGIDKLVAERNRGITTWQMLFHEDYNIIQRIPKRFIPIIISQMLSTYRTVTEKYKNKPIFFREFRALKNNHYVSKYWIDNYDKQYIPFSLDFRFKYNKTIPKIDIQVSNLGLDNRFFIVKYFPMDVKTTEVFNSLKKVGKHH